MRKAVIQPTLHKAKEELRMGGRARHPSAPWPAGRPQCDEADKTSDEINYTSGKDSLSPSSKTTGKEEKPGLGWPGYRTREGRTGWDPIDADNEAAHMTGTILRRLFYGRVRGPIWLLLLGLLGAAMISPLVLTMIELIKGNMWPLNNWLLVLITGAAGIAILINFIRNLIVSLFR